MTDRSWLRVFVVMLGLCLGGAARSGEAPPEPGPGPASKPARPKDPFKDIYTGYRPPFLEYVTKPSRKKMKLSTERSFFTVNQIHTDDRANALVEAAIGRERQQRYREALNMYQIVIDKYPHDLYRVSPYGVFVPVSQYCQRRILNLPPLALEHYRTIHDPRARESYQSARRKHSLIGLSQVVDKMLATSYGSKAILELGNAALDSGHHLAALEYYTTVRDFFPDPISRSTEVDLKIALCRKMLGEPAEETPPADKTPGTLEPRVRAGLQKLVEGAKPEKKPFHSQLASEPYVGTDDYTLFPPSKDPLALEEPQWEEPLPGTGGAPRGPAQFSVYTQPVVTEDSVIYRHKNIVYSRSILNGEYRWVNDLGGRARWQNWGGRQYPLENLIVHGGLVFTVVSKGGPSLVALDQVTGQLKWAYGPMTASTEEEARMRFEAPPAAGPRAVFIGYVLDNIEGESHTDTEYGVMAFDSTSGRILWRVPLCRLAPGKFTAGFARRVRNRIRSFISPPLYSQGTVYYCTNAGAVAALDARSGRIKWLIRYPYYTEGGHGGDVHDATRQFGSGGGPVRYTSIYFRPHRPMFWFNQRPLLIGERLYVLPVDAGYMLCLNRRTGKVAWTKRKGLLYDTHSWRKIVRVSAGFTHLLGALKTGELVFAYSFPKKPPLIVDPKTGKTLWPIVQKHPPSRDTTHSVERESHPCMSLGTPSAGLGKHCSVPMNGRHYELGARPMLSRDGKLYLTQWNYIGWPIYAWTSSLCVYDLVERKQVHRRRYYSGRLLAYVHRSIREWAPQALKAHEELPHKEEKVKQWIRNLKKVVKDTVPTNRYRPFLPFSRLTFRRYDVQFELRFGARSVAMVYDKAAVRRELATRTGPQADFARAELAVAEARYADAATLLKTCLRTVSSENLDFRSVVNQQLYRVYRRLARAGIRSGDAGKELQSGLGMSRTASTLADEIETLFALSEAYERQGDFADAARCLRSIVSTYGHHEYPVAEAAALDSKELMGTAHQVLEKADTYAKSEYFGEEFRSSVRLLRRGLPMYLSTVSPLPRRLTVRAGELAARRLVRLQERSDEFDDRFERLAAAGLADGSPAEQLYHIWEFPGTEAAQTVHTRLLRRAASTDTEASRQRLWELADAARVCDLRIPEDLRGRTRAPDRPVKADAARLPAEPRRHDIAHEEGINWLILERRGDRSSHPDLLFLGGRVRKRFDNKFIVRCMNLETNRKEWERMNLRLKGTGQEPGFFSAFVHRDILLVHGLYDVLAFQATTGELLWRFRVPFNFEIKTAVLSGDLLVLGGKTETLALYVRTPSRNGEVAWQVSEMGDQYIAPYFHGDRLVSVRKNPFNVTVRYRTTGKLIGRLELPDLSMYTAHPLVETGARELPVAHHGPLLAVTDTWYYVLVDVERMAVLWKRQIDNSDQTQNPAMRFELNDDYLAVIKEDYDVKTIYMLSTRTGEVLWHTDPKAADTPRPVHGMMIDGDTLYGIGVHPGQGFYIVRMDCKTGRRLFRTEVTGYNAKPIVRLVHRRYTTGGTRHGLVKVQDRQDFYVLVFDLDTGEVQYRLKTQGAGSFGVHGQASATLQNGRVVLLSKDKLDM